MHYKKIAAVLLSVAMCIQSAVPVMAVETAADETDISIEREIETEEESTSKEEASDTVSAEETPETENTQRPETESQEENAETSDIPEENQETVSEEDQEETPASKMNDSGESIETDAQDTGTEVYEEAGENHEEAAASYTEEDANEEDEDIGEIEIQTDDIYVDMDDADLPSEEDMIAGYIDSVMMPEQSSARLRADKATAGDNLGGMNRALYKAVRPMIKETAEGTRSDTVFEVYMSDIDLEKKSWTADELGVDAIVVNGSVPQSVVQKVMKKINFSYDILLDALLADEPCSLYWFDKTGNIKMSGFSLSAKRNSDGEMTIGLKGSVKMYMPVVAEYAVSEYEIDESFGQSITTAKENAAAIVEENEGKTDYAKLKAYKDRICELTRYNYNAVNTDTAYGNPWQLIWVFDGDNSTNVVCEGYAKAFKYLCDLSTFNYENASCILVTGYMDINGSSGLHMWNVVRAADGNNYLVDVTNCDSGTIGYPDELFMVGPDEEDDTGNTIDGYTINADGSNVKYIYYYDIVNIFEEEDLALGSGKYIENNMFVTDISEALVTLSQEDYIYNGNKQVPDITVSLNGRILIEGIDYDIETDDATNAGTKSVTIIGKGNYEGAVSSEYNIWAADIGLADITLSENEYTWTGEAIFPEIIAMYNGMPLEKGRDFVINYENNIDEGTGYIHIEGIGNYEGVYRTLEFRIIKPDAQIGFVTENGKTYYYDDNGEKHTGILYTDEDIYYFNSDGTMARCRWITENGSTYFFGSDGRAYKGMCSIAGKPFYFDENGARKLGIVNVNQNTYYMVASGMARNQWITIGSKKYYFDNDGIAMTGINVIDDDIYCFNNDGTMIRSRWINEAGSTYFFGNDGKAYIGMCSIAGKPFYFDENGARKLGIVNVNQNIYYMTPAGMARQQWVTVGGKTYYFDENGIAMTGLNTIDGDIYYFNSNGTMAKGRWITIDKKNYFFGIDGKAYIGVHVINGKTFYFDEEGRLSAMPAA